MPDLREALKTGRVILMDGAMGTELQRAGLKDGECGELWNLTRPDVVADIHRRYVLAGAQCLVTNTFQSNPTALAKHGIDELEAINREAVLLARSVAGPDRFVLGSIGPMRLRAAEERQLFDRVASALQSADAILLETWYAPIGYLAAGRACQRHNHPESKPIVLSFAYHKDSSSHAGLQGDAASAALVAQRFPLACLGANCGREIGVEEMVQVVLGYRRNTSMAILARPNAGTPVRNEDAWVYPRTPEAMAARLPELIDAGATLIGGCCGTTPAHIAAFRKVIDRLGVGWQT